MIGILPIHNLARLLVLVNLFKNPFHPYESIKIPMCLDKCAL